MFCRAGNKYIPERKRSRPNFLFRERTFLFRDRTVQIEEKNSPLEEKEMAETFSIEGILVSCPTYIHSLGLGNACFDIPRSGLSDLGKEKYSLGKGSWALSFSI